MIKVKTGTVLLFWTFPTPYLSFAGVSAEMQSYACNFPIGQGLNEPCEIFVCVCAVLLLLILKCHLVLISVVAALSTRG